MTASITPERIVNELPRIGSPAISPDGSRILYVRATVDPKTGQPHPQLWIAAPDGSTPRRLTWGDAGDHSPAWSPDGSALAFVRSAEDTTSIMVLDLTAGGEARPLTTHAVGISSLAWAPDGTSLLYTARVDPENPNEAPVDPKAPPKVRVITRMDYKSDVYGYLNDVRLQVFTLDVATGERTQRTSDPVDHTSPAWSPDGKTIAFTTSTHNGFMAQLGILDLASDTTTTYSGGPRSAISSPFWTPDGTAILFAQSESVQPAETWSRYDLASGTATQLTGEVEFLAMGRPSGPVWLEDTRAIVHGLYRARTGFWSIDATTGAISELAHSDWYGTEGAILPDGSGAICAMTSLEGVAGLSRLDFGTGQTTVLVDEGTAFFAETPSAQWDVVTIERAPYTIEGWLFKPADFDPGRRYPLVLDVHGGPTYWHAPNLDEMAQVFATNDMLILRPNPRGSGSYGPDFGKQVFGDWGGEDWKDLQAILDHVLTFPYIDPERTGIFGYSYGGYMTSWAIGHTDRFKAAIVGAPCFDFESFFGTSDIGPDFNALDTPAPFWEEREALLTRSPSEFIQNAVTPTMVVHGEADERCPIGQGEQVFISLMKLGVETEFVRYPGASHLFVWDGLPAHRIDFLGRTLAWFKRFLGDPAPSA
ncbi:MAG: S9 family peptidase [Thermomicrobiales bacterium]